MNKNKSLIIVLITTLLILSSFCYFYPTKEIAPPSPKSKAETAFVASIWDQKAEEWDSHVGDNGEKNLNRVYQSDPILWQMLGDVRSLTVLDVGCGTGYLSRHLARKGANVIGTDISPKMIEISQNKTTQEGLQVDYRVDDNAGLSSLPDNSVDKIVSNYVLMDVPNLEESILALFRVLKPGGEATLVFLHPCFPLDGKYNEPKNFKVAFGWNESYFEEYTRDIPAFDNFSSNFVVFHRPLSAYWKAFREAGFDVVDFQEPHLSEGAKEELRKINPELVNVFNMEPLTVAFHLKKPIG